MKKFPLGKGQHVLLGEMGNQHWSFYSQSGAGVESLKLEMLSGKLQEFNQPVWSFRQETLLSSHTETSQESLSCVPSLLKDQ